MAPPREQRIEELAEAASAQDVEQRTAFLNGACGEDTALRIEVERVLLRRVTSNEAAPPSALGTQAPTLPACEGTEDGPPALRIASYRILGVLGEGSMGVVYRAEQDNPHRVVALKVLKAGGASASALERFRREAELLGRLQHPGIAQVLEAGTASTPYGTQPFLAMELIEGVPLVAYAEGHDLGIRERFALIVKVCEGVQHAHLKGVIHRDLKPGNILVDERAQPKILDFGIALAADSETRDGASDPARRQLAGTVPYMSFEQTRRDTHELDTRTDVYALGVITYELLTGRLPYDLRGKTITDACRILGAQDPIPLSHGHKALRGEVEAIVGNALKRDKVHRYQSASDLAADIRRLLSDEPISVYAPNALYQVKKFAKRNRTLVVGAVGVLAMLLVAVVGTTHGYREAEREARKSRAVNEFLNEMLSCADPKALGKDVTVRQALDEAGAKLDAGDLEDQPEVEAAIRLTLGKTYMSLSAFGPAEKELRRAEAIARRVLGDQHRDTLWVRTQRTELLWHKGDYARAEALGRRTLRAQRRILGDEHEHTLETRHNLAVSLWSQKKLAEAEAIARDTLHLERRVLGEKHSKTLVTMSALALIHESKGAFEEAERLHREIIAIQSETRGTDHPETLASAHNLAELLRVQRRLPEAEQRHRQTLLSRREKLGDEHASTVTSMHNLALVLQAQGKLDQAEPLLRETLRHRRKLGNGHESTIKSIVNLATLRQEQRDLAEAVSLFRETLSLRHAQGAPDAPEVATTLVRLGIALVEHGEAAEAEPLLRQCLDIRRRTLAEGHWLIANVENALGACLTVQGRYGEAEEFLLRSHPVIQDQRGAHSPPATRSLRRIIELYDAWGKPELARPWRHRRDAAGAAKPETSSF